jgi:hypothetical protein
MIYWLIGLALIVIIVVYALFYVLVTILDGISLLHHDMKTIADEIIEIGNDAEKRESRNWH